MPRVFLVMIKHSCMAIVTLALPFLPLFLFLLLLLVAAVFVAVILVFLQLLLLSVLAAAIVFEQVALSLRSHTNPCQSLSIKYFEASVDWMIMPLASWTSSPSSPRKMEDMEDTARGTQHAQHAQHAQHW